MKIEPIEIEQGMCRYILIDVSDDDEISISQGSEIIWIERSNIQQLIDILEHEKA